MIFFYWSALTVHFNFVPVPQTQSQRLCEAECCTFSIVAVSSISAMKVDMPLSWLSLAPTRASMASMMVSSASRHGMKQPSWASRTDVPIYTDKHNNNNNNNNVTIISRVPQHGNRFHWLLGISGSHGPYLKHATTACHLCLIVDCIQTAS